MKVLLSAFSCSPGLGSEPAVGWNWVEQIRGEHEVWLLTCDVFRENIERERPSNVHVIYVPIPRFYRPLEELRLGFHWPYYYWWQWKAYRVARKVHAQVGFDLAHHVTFVSWRAPAFVCLLPIPFVWGPVGGGGVPPRCLHKELGWRGALTEGFRSLCQQASRWDPLVRLTMRRAAVILVGNRETGEIIQARYRQKVRTLLAIGMSKSQSGETWNPAPRTAGFLVLFIALLRPLKGGTLAINAFARLIQSYPEAKMIIIGDGPDRDRLMMLAKRMNLGERVQFSGLLPQLQVQGWMSSCDAVLLPSLRDSGAMVLLEAMSEGKPVVCLDLGGNGEIVTEQCGFKVRVNTPDQVVSELAAALHKLAGDPRLCRAMGAAGRRRVEEQFDWDKRGQRMLEIYAQVTGRPPTGTEPKGLAVSVKRD